MKQLFKISATKFLLLFLFSCMQLKVWAQDSTVSTTVNKTTDFFSQPWVWIVGGIILLLILAALFSGNSNKSKVITKTTVIKEEKVE